ncbi:helix-turn-helix domain-containing protein [Lentzea jiangxiensis]|uniref:Regulatory protein, Fis family n=1 Tax=Lentzea jiangxiensis TaxID=641025 RepID=A0A1H0X981_9PSEU|nr:regulatory protein, Fis family [Lentzea jiangxiensis]
MLIKGPGVMRGYHNRPAETAETLIDGWLHTGDIGELDERGRLTITDREKELIKTSGGKYVAPARIESLLKAASPYIGNAIVHGDRRKYCVALVTLDPDTSAGLGDAQAEVRRAVEQVNAQLARHEQLKRFALLERDFSGEDALLTTSLKPRRRENRQTLRIRAERSLLTQITRSDPKGRRPVDRQNAVSAGSSAWLSREWVHMFLLVLGRHISSLTHGSPPCAAAQETKMTRCEPKLIGSAVVRPEIEASWRRSQRIGLSPLSEVFAAPVRPVPSSHPLRRLAADVLSRFEKDISGSPFTAVLADAGGVIVDLRPGLPEQSSELDAAGVVVGRQFTEPLTGTNSISLTIELGQPVAVIGAEHFLTRFKDFACYGYPIMAPSTGRLAGVLNLACPLDMASPLSLPLLRRFAQEIEHRIRMGAPAASPANQLVDPRLPHYRRQRLPVLVAGERGSGRTTAVWQLAGTNPILRLDLTRSGHEQLAAGHSGLVLVENVDALGPAEVAKLAHLLDAGTCWIALTSKPLAELDHNGRAFAARCAGRVELSPLRDRLGELPALVHEHLAALGAAGRLRFADTAWGALRRHTWLDNFRELHDLVEHLLSLRTTREITVHDLPERFRHNCSKQPRSLMAKTEYDLIVKALRTYGGNRVKAAEHLGISRSTLHRRLRTFGIAA